MPRPQGHGQNAAHAAYLAAERQLADHGKTFERRAIQRTRGSQHAQRDGQVKSRPLLLHVRRGQVDRRTPHRRRETGVDQRRLYAVFALLDGHIGQANDDRLGIAVPGVDLDVDRERLNAVNRSGHNPRQHGLPPPGELRVRPGYALSAR